MILTHITLLTLTLTACSSGTGDDADAVRVAYDAYKSAPTSVNLETLRDVVELTMEIPRPDNRLKIELGAALSNGLLRPDMGVVMLASSVRDEWAQEEYLDALARHDPYALRQALPAYDFDPGHSTARDLSQQAAQDGTADWRTLVNGVMAAQILDDVRRVEQFIMNESVPSTEALLHALAVLIPSWSFTTVMARSTTRVDTDPLMSKGVIEAHGGRRRVMASAFDAGADALAPMGRLVDEMRSPNTITMVIKATSPEGREIVLAMEGEHTKTGFRLFAGSDRGRTVVMAQAANVYAQQLATGAPQEQALKEMVDTFGEALLNPMHAYR